MIFAWITMPDVATMSAKIGGHTSIFFDEFWGIALAVVGILIGAMVVRWLFLRTPMKAIRSIVGGGRRRGRRR